MMKISKKLNILAIFLIVASLIMLSETLGYLPGIYRIWPIFPFLLGLGFIILFINKKKSDIPMVGIGVFLTLASTLFFYFNYTSWLNISLLWPLFIGFIGISFGTCSLFISLKIFRYLSLFLISLCIIFLLVFSISYKFWPISITLLGLSFLLINMQENEDEKKQSRKPEK